MFNVGKYCFGWWACLSTRWGALSVEVSRPRHWRYHPPVHVWWSDPDAGADDNV